MGYGPVLFLFRLSTGLACCRCLHAALHSLSGLLLVFSSPSFLSLQVAGQYVGEDRQLQRTLVRAMLLAGELSLGQEHILRFGLQVGQGQKARRDAVAFAHGCMSRNLAWLLNDMLAQLQSVMV